MSAYPFRSNSQRSRRKSVLPGLAARIGLAACAAVLAAGGRSSGTEEASFAAENSAAMDQMMAGMSVAPSGGIDRDFATMMIAHHQGAIAMAVAELRHGRNEQLRRLAQGIIVEQQQEIAAMRIAVSDRVRPASGSPGTGLSTLPSRPGQAAPAVLEKEH